MNFINKSQKEVSNFLKNFGKTDKKPNAKSGTLLVGGQPEANGNNGRAGLGRVTLHLLWPHLGGIHVTHRELHLVAIPARHGGPSDLQDRSHRSLKLIYLTSQVKRGENRHSYEKNAEFLLMVRKYQIATMLHAVLWIRIRLDPYICGSPGSGSVPILNTNHDPATLTQMAISKILDIFLFRFQCFDF